MPNSNGAVAYYLFVNKFRTNNFLKKSGIPVAPYKKYLSDEDAYLFLEKHKSIVVKPMNGMQGNDVHVQIEKKSELQRIPPFVTGNGESTIEDLIRVENEARLQLQYEKDLRPIIITDDMHSTLKRAGKTINSVVQKGERVQLNTIANLSKGGTSKDITEELTEEIKSMAIRISKISNTQIIGIDVLSKDISNLEESHTVIEVNPNAGVKGHLAPVVGKQRNVISVLLRQVFDLDEYNTKV